MLEPISCALVVSSLIKLPDQTDPLCADACFSTHLHQLLYVRELSGNTNTSRNHENVSIVAHVLSTATLVDHSWTKWSINPRPVLAAWLQVLPNFSCEPRSSTKKQKYCICFAAIICFPPTDAEWMGLKKIEKADEGYT